MSGVSKVAIALEVSAEKLYSGESRTSESLAEDDRFSDREYCLTSRFF